uniref:Uncharacterized protein n=1 Tax=Arundo donax TaxID=35708 RepID=A0A0A8ZLP4_ARUDO
MLFIFNPTKRLDQIFRICLVEIL